MDTTSELQEDQGKLAKLAANVCLAAPLLVFALAFAINFLNKSLAGQVNGPISKLLILALAGVSCLLMLTGLIMGIVALVQMKPGSRGSVVLKSLAGMTLTALILAIAVPNFVRARTNALANNRAYADLTAASADFKNKVAASMQDTNASAPSVEQLQRKLNEISGTATGDEAQILKASGAYAGRIAVLQKNYRQAASDLTAASVLSTSNLLDRSTIQERRAIVQKFLKSNEEMKDFLDQGETMYSQELDRFKVPADKKEAALNGFRQARQPQLKATLEIRNNDEHMGQAMLDTLDLLDTEWGHWHFNQKTARLVFENQPALDQYNDFLRQIRDARDNELASQKQLALILQKPTAQTTQ